MAVVRRRSSSSSGSSGGGSGSGSLFPSLRSGQTCAQLFPGFSCRRLGDLQTFGMILWLLCVLQPATCLHRRVMLKLQVKAEDSCCQHRSCRRYQRLAAVYDWFMTVAPQPDVVSSLLFRGIREARIF